MASHSIRPGATGFSKSSYFRRLPIIRLLVLVFFVLIVSISLKMLMDINNLAEIGTTLRLLTKREIPEIEIIGEIRTYISEQESVILKALVEGDIDSARRQINELSQQTEHLLQQYESLHQEIPMREEAFFAKVTEQQQTLSVMSDAVIELLANNENANARAVFIGPWEDVHHSAFTSLDDLLNFEIAKIARVTYQTEELINSARFTSVAVALVSILLSLILIIIIVTSFSRPMDDILLAMEQVLRGESIAKVNIYPNKNSIPLIQRFNQVLTWLYGSFEDSCHELRTSITVIRGEAEVALRTPEQMSKEDYRESLDSIKNVAWQMGNLVDDLVFLGRSQVGQIEYQNRQIDIAELLADVVRQCQGLAVLKNIELNSDIEYPGMLNGDFQRLRQLFVILLDNAIKYTDPGGQVAVKLVADDKSCKISITDTGIGIQESDLPHIFDRFYRVASGRPRPAGGSGLGLAIAKSIVQAHRAEIIVDSHMNTGTTMTVVFAHSSTS